MSIIFLAIQTRIRGCRDRCSVPTNILTLGFAKLIVKEGMLPFWVIMFSVLIKLELRIGNLMCEKRNWFGVVRLFLLFILDRFEDAHQVLDEMLQKIDKISSNALSITHASYSRSFITNVGKTKVSFPFTLALYILFDILLFFVFHIRNLSTNLLDSFLYNDLICFLHFFSLPGHSVLACH